MKRNVFLIIIGIILFAGLILGFKSCTTNSADVNELQNLIKSKDAQLKAKDVQIQQLQQQVEELQKEQVIYEDRINQLNRRRVTIQQPQTSNELVERFKKLGYTVRVVK
jgi:peptidoglycan hydrolase CwlO-like protein